MIFNVQMFIYKIYKRYFHILRKSILMNLQCTYDTFTKDYLYTYEIYTKDRCTNDFEKALKD